MFEYGRFDVFWNRDSSVRVRDKEFNVAVDPNEDFQDFEAGIVLITREDSFDFDVLKEICGRGTCAVLPASLSELEVPCVDVEYLKPGEKIDIFGVGIEALEGGDLAYFFDMQGTSFYVSGGSGYREKLIELENRVDVAFLEASGDLDKKDIVRTAVRIKPDLVVPYMYRNESVNLDGLKAELEDRNISCLSVDRPT